ncbi:MAG: hypothetical protein BroJett011_11410 [Chloroflexota bacterium]|nr:MAG: hypothetical protein BroJett011_11410 [Chloroflexota bacterium]
MRGYLGLGTGRGKAGQFVSAPSADDLTGDCNRRVEGVNFCLGRIGRVKYGRTIFSLKFPNEMDLAIKAQVGGQTGRRLNGAKN